MLKLTEILFIKKMLIFEESLFVIYPESNEQFYERGQFTFFGLLSSSPFLLQRFRPS